MPDIIIRGISDEVHSSLKEKAAMDGKPLETWLRDKLAVLATQPAIRNRYGFKAFCEDGAYVSIKRESDGYIQQGARNCNSKQFDAYKQACDYVQRNEADDYGKAYKLLSSNFDEIITL